MLDPWKCDEVEAAGSLHQISRCKYFFFSHCPNRFKLSISISNCLYLSSSEVPNNWYQSIYWECCSLCTLHKIQKIMWTMNISIHRTLKKTAWFWKSIYDVRNKQNIFIWRWKKKQWLRCNIFSTFYIIELLHPCNQIRQKWTLSIFTHDSTYSWWYRDFYNSRNKDL